MGGRGSGSRMSSGGGGDIPINSVINAGQMSKLPLGSQVEVQNLSGITKKPTGTTTTFTLTSARYSGDVNPRQVWVGAGYSDIRNDSVDIFNSFGNREIRLKKIGR